MHTDAFYTDKYAVYEDQFDPSMPDHQTWQRRRLKSRRVPKTKPEQMAATLTDDLSGEEIGFQTTYHPSRYEAGWLLDSVRTFYEQALITDVLAQVKGGKEASVYRCAADLSTGVDLLAAKVYRPQQFRNLRNDKLYRSGRQVLTAEGRPVKTTDHRVMRAIGKKSNFGRQVSHTSWLMHEFTVMHMLHQAGAAVPLPLAASENAILMSYLGDAKMAAPTLSQVNLEPDEAVRLFDEVLRNLHLMLAREMVHGDLSAYNLLYWEGTITLIDFPQVVNIFSNDQAYYILHRDIQRVCDYFATQGVIHDPDALTDQLWKHYIPEGFDTRADVDVV
ncbi:MAG: hypothetical protein JXA33_21010 [Anaerolineae bacterium]|nr:hypothetical protein [Anaerolineae bacterium]